MRPRPAARPASKSVGSLAGVLALAATLQAAPARAEEVQVPLDRSGRIERVDAQLARRLGLFTDRYPGFAEARLFRLADSTFTLEVTMARGRQLVRERVPLTAAGADSLRQRISTLVAANAPEAAVNQEGRTLMLAGSTLLGLGFYGWAFPVAMDVQGAQSFAGIYMLTAGGSFFLPFAATLEQPVTFGMSNLAIYGATRGIPHGILVYQLFVDNKDTDNGNLGSAVAASMVEGVGGYLWAKQAGLSAGSATTIATLGDYGLLEGLGFARLSEYHDQDRHRAAAASMLLGSAAGLAAGSALAAHRDYSYGDAAVMRNAGFLGVFASQMITDWFDPRDDKAFVTAAMIGGTAGLAAGDRLVRGTRFTAGQSVIVTLGMVAGAAVGLGVAFVSSGDQGDNGTFLLSSSMVGSAIGFAATYRSLLSAAGGPRTERSSWRIEISPLGLTAAAADAKGAGGRGATLPLVRAEYRF